MLLKIGFICIGNSCRSQIAEGFAKKYGNGLFDVFSAGTHPASKVSENAVTVMKEKGIDISGQYPKGLEKIPQELDIVITMGCGVECPYLFSDYRQDWDLEDPVGMPIEKFRKTRDIIEKRIKEIIEYAEGFNEKEKYIDYLNSRGIDKIE